MNFQVHSKASIQCGIDPQVPHLIISITNSDDKHPPFIIPNKHNKGILRLVFDDIDKVDSHGQLVVFSEAIAREIAEFVKTPAELILCQCEAGISRSSGLAAALSVFFNGEDNWVFTGSGVNGRFFPNKRVRKLTLAVLMQESKKATEEKFELKKSLPALETSDE